MDLAAVGNEEAHALAAVVRAAAAKGEEAVASLFLIHGEGLFHVLVRGVRHSAVVHFVLHIGFIEDIGDALQDTAGHDALIGNDEGVLGIAAGESVRNLLAAARADKRNRGDVERSDLTNMQVLDVAHKSIPLLVAVTVAGR